MGAGSDCLAADLHQQQFQCRQYTCCFLNGHGSKPDTPRVEHRHASSKHSHCCIEGTLHELVNLQPYTNSFPKESRLVSESEVWCQKRLASDR